MYLSFDFAARSDVGLVRSSNQDSAFAGTQLLVVADGMGGAAGGDIASSIVAAGLAPLEGEDLGPEEALESLKQAIADAHSDIVQRAKNDPELSGLGTTVTAILRSGATVSMAHIGDSRAYLLRDGLLDQVTNDHSFVQHLVDTGRLSEADAENHPKRSMLLRVLGDIDADVPVDVSAREAKAGDRWLLCSDGLSGVVSRKTITATMVEEASAATCAEALVRLALAAGAPDNVTCVVADVVDLDSIKGDAPATAQQIVGAAADHRHRPSEGGETPAGKAAKLTAPVTREAETSSIDWHGIWERVRPYVLPALAVIVVLGAAWGGYSWTQQQYYVSTNDGYVTIYRGIPQNLGPISLSSLYEQTSLSTDDLKPFEVTRLDGAIQAGSLEEAEAVVASLEDSV